MENPEVFHHINNRSQNGAASPSQSHSFSSQNYRPDEGDKSMLRPVGEKSLRISGYLHTLTADPHNSLIAQGKNNSFTMEKT